MIKLMDIVKESLEDETGKDWLNRHGAKIDDKGRVIAYHTTTYKKAKLIKQTGFRSGSYFSLKPEYSRSVVKIYHGLKDRGITTLEVHLPTNSVDFVASILVAVKPIKFEETI